MFNKLTLFLQESRQELKRVNWPTLAETRRFTLIVVVLSLAVSIFLGVLDAAFLFILERVLGL